MTLQQSNPANDDGKTVSEGAVAVPKPDERGMFPFGTINGTTGDASGGPININQGDLVRTRLYNASGMSHSIHLHGMDMTLVDINGHPTELCTAGGYESPCSPYPWSCSTSREPSIKTDRQNTSVFVREQFPRTAGFHQLRRPGP
ncbi:multicopper oxidase domain-containing protein [Arthrobacter sp. U41]|uniref:multicopper oxidase domain-containing protein n=1 Tax=Arthrobacter sp. U41 TaxID=1849032 RepID=UPI0008593EE0|nr:multicopper oxidase domain-containing protein [Arthrobacter sp. U41]AOT04688.1 hypothetical protein ASPU41_16565 [Arthrobacter sp. U41]